MNKTFSEQMEQILKEVGDAASDSLEEASKAAAQRSARQLRSVSPTNVHGKLRGAYKKAWGYTREGKGYVVYNKKYPGLTHLLENGHVTRNQYGEYGRTPAHPHIKQVDDVESAAYLEDVINKLDSKI